MCIGHRFRRGDAVRVAYRVKEGNRSRVQNFEGIVIKNKRNGYNTSFTVGKVSYGVGVEGIVPLNSPLIEKIEIVQRGRARPRWTISIFSMRGEFRGTMPSTPTP
ncbi:50S ribosomal protein L19 [Thermus scotoductus]|uniref:50S ribosomal protein L19 n=1 Tax=Thermus scotoductus TaxID=37636 RepID=UPI003F512E6F